MKHLVAGAVAMVMMGLAFFVIWANRTHIGVGEMAFAGGFVLMGAGLLVPLDVKEAVAPLDAVVKIVRGKTDG